MKINIMKKKHDTNFCCSILFPRSMHQPGYVQGGQEASLGYLLLGIYYRRIPGETILLDPNTLLP
jgi:hypothetical protein